MRQVFSPERSQNTVAPTEVIVLRVDIVLIARARGIPMPDLVVPKCFPEPNGRPINPPYTWVRWYDNEAATRKQRTLKHTPTCTTRGALCF